MSIHRTALIDLQAEIDSSADIGPFCILEGPVTIGPRTRLLSHVIVRGYTTIGRECEIHPFVCLGDTPQDKAFKDCRSFCTIGDNCILREGVTVHRGTAEDSITRIGDRCFLMANSHVGHNCRVGDDVVLVNGALLAGHVHVGPRALVSGNAGIHQFVRVGELAMVSGVAKISMDVPPFFTTGRSATCEGVNVIGMRRAGFSAADRSEIKEAFRLLYRSGRTFRAALEELRSIVQTEAGRRLVAFLDAPSKRGIVSGRSTRHAAAPLADVVME